MVEQKKAMQKLLIMKMTAEKVLPEPIPLRYKSLDESQPEQSLLYTHILGTGTISQVFLAHSSNNLYLVKKMDKHKITPKQVTRMLVS